MKKIKLVSFKKCPNTPGLSYDGIGLREPCKGLLDPPLSKRHCIASETKPINTVGFLINYGAFNVNTVNGQFLAALNRITAKMSLDKEIYLRLYIRRLMTTRNNTTQQ